MRIYKPALFLAVLLTLSNLSNAAIFTQNSNKLPGILGIGTNCNLTMQFQNQTPFNINIVSISGVPAGAQTSQGINQTVPLTIQPNNSTAFMISQINNPGTNIPITLNFTYTLVPSTNLNNNLINLTRIPVIYPFNVSVTQQGGVCSVVAVTPQQATVGAHTGAIIIANANTLVFNLQ